MSTARLSDAIETIGSIAEHDLSGEDAIKLSVALRALADFACHKGRGKVARLGGDIPKARIEEAAAEAAYDSLPTPYRW